MSSSWPLLVGVLWLSAQTPAQPPTFQDFPATEMFQGVHAAPQLTTPEARRFRTRLREAIQYGPNFAGRYTLARWGCGAGCVVTAVIDAASGQVWFAPFTFSDAVAKGGSDAIAGGRIVCHHGSDFERTSELYVVQGDVNGKVGVFSYRWHDHAFSLVHFDPRCEG